jgi:serpin B
MKKQINYLFIIACSIIISSCDSKMSDDSFIKSEPIKIALTSNEVQITANNNNFAMDFFSALYKNSENTENIIISPFSVSMALAMVWNGAEEETKQAIQDAIGMGNYPQSEVNSYFKKMNDALLKTDPNTKLAIANSIWANKGFPVKQSFYDVNKNWYNAETRELDFSSPDALKTINKWCSDNTNGLIDKILEEIPENMRMYLLNALYFKGIWSSRFDANDTKKLPFYKEDGTSVSVDMMHQNTNLNYYADENLTLTSLGYGNGAFSMVFVLPQQNVTFDNMLVLLQQPDYFNNCLQNSFTADVDLYIPKFKIEYEEMLNKTLESLGMGIAFNRSLANFSGISDIPLFISMVKQKAYIDVNEKGTEAAAVTAVGMEVTSAIEEPQKVTFRADHPFLFAIRENSTGTILFMGKVGNPK